MLIYDNTVVIDGSFPVPLFYRGFSRRGTHPVRAPSRAGGRHVGFFWNNKICFNFVSISEKIKLTVSERTYIYCSYGVIRLYEV